MTATDTPPPSLEDRPPRPDPVDDLLDLFVYAPLALVLNAQEHVPRLAQQGRNQVGAARIIGDVAVARGAKTAGDLFGAVLAGFGLVRDSSYGSGSRPQGASARSPEPHAAEPSGAPAEEDLAPRASVDDVATPAAAAPSTDDPSSRPAPSAEELPLNDYESLAASQVVPRLRELSPDELDLVGRFEAANRGRRTILNRVAQLQAGRG